MKINKGRGGGVRTGHIPDIFDRTHRSGTHLTDGPEVLHSFMMRQFRAIFGKAVLEQIRASVAGVEKRVGGY